MQRVLLGWLLLCSGGGGREDMVGGGAIKNELPSAMLKRLRASSHLVVETARAVSSPWSWTWGESTSDGGVSRKTKSCSEEGMCGEFHLYNRKLHMEGRDCFQIRQKVHTPPFCMQMKGGERSRGREDEDRNYGLHERRKSKYGPDKRSQTKRKPFRKSSRRTDPEPSGLQQLKGKLRAKIRAAVKGNHTDRRNYSDHIATSDEDQAYTKKHRPGSFPALGIEDSIAKALMHAGYKFPTPVQRKSIPELLSGANVVMMARTGSGKTAAFLVPLIQRIRAISDSNWAQGKVIGIQGLVLVPTRELALQTFNFFKLYAKYTQLTACLIVGGEALEPQFAALATNPNVVIATPGRLLQLLNEVRRG